MRSRAASSAAAMRDPAASGRPCGTGRPSASSPSAMASAVATVEMKQSSAAHTDRPAAIGTGCPGGAARRPIRRLPLRATTHTGSRSIKMSFRGQIERVARLRSRLGPRRPRSRKVRWQHWPATDQGAPRSPRAASRPTPHR
jgi:hypothetical protein